MPMCFQLLKLIFKSADMCCMKNERLNEEKGSVMIELAVVAPIMVAIWVFLVDFYFLSRTMTSLTQAVRDVGIYYATDQNYQSLGAAQLSITSGENGFSWVQYSKTSGAPDCSTLNDPGFDPMRSVSERAYFLLQGQGSNLSMAPTAQSGFAVVTTNDGSKVSVRITSRLNSLFYFRDKILDETVVLRRMGPNCSTS